VGFTEFVPLSLIHQRASDVLEEARGRVSGGGATASRSFGMHALARLGRAHVRTSSRRG